ncbi:hypothetical protein BASA61_008234 [Batrachochytrium salamandrivorans]|nr:hypothetical protein BASA61_008234 [Batrachochytrium salamandrivorans]
METPCGLKTILQSAFKTMSTSRISESVDVVYVQRKVNTNETIHRSTLWEKESPNSGKSRHERPLPPLPRFISSNEHGQGHSSSLTGASHCMARTIKDGESQSNLRFGGAYGDPTGFFDPALSHPRHRRIHPPPMDDV